MALSFAAGLLHLKIAALCPILGIAIGDPADKTTWRIDFDPAATAQQIAAAQSFVANVDINALNPWVITTDAFLARFTAAEQTAIWNALAGHPTILGQIIIWLGHGLVDLTDTNVKTKMDQLVTLGIITQARETAILTP